MLGLKSTGVQAVVFVESHKVANEACSPAPPATKDPPLFSLVTRDLEASSPFPYPSIFRFPREKEGRETSKGALGSHCVSESALRLCLDEAGRSAG